MAGDIYYQLLSENKQYRINIEGQLILVSELKKRISQELGHKEELCIYSADQSREYQDNERISVHTKVLVERKQNSINPNYSNSKFLKCDRCQGQNPTKTQCCQKKICKNCKDESKRIGKCIFCGLTQQQSDKQNQIKNENLRKIKESLNLPSDKEYQSVLENARFFFIRSCNQENITFALQHSIWATTQKNERVLFDAFKKTQNIILIFGVNKTNYFQGVARMQHQINDKQNYKTPWKNTEAIKLGEDFIIRWLRVEDLQHSNCSDLKNALCGNEQLTNKPKDCQEIDQENGKKLCLRFSLNIEEGGYLGSSGQTSQLGDWSSSTMMSKGNMGMNQYGNISQFNNTNNQMGQQQQYPGQLMNQQGGQIQQPSPQQGFPSQNNLNPATNQYQVPGFNGTSQLDENRMNVNNNFANSNDITNPNLQLSTKNSSGDADTTILLSEHIRQYNQSIELSEDDFFNILEDLQPYRKTNQQQQNTNSSIQDGQSARDDAESILDKVKSSMEMVDEEPEYRNQQDQYQQNFQQFDDEGNQLNSQMKLENDNESIEGNKDFQAQSKSQFDQADDYSNNNYNNNNNNNNNNNTNNSNANNDQVSRESLGNRNQRSKEDDLSDDENENNYDQNDEEGSQQNFNNNGNNNQRDYQSNSNNSSENNIQNKPVSSDQVGKEEKQQSSDDLKKKIPPNPLIPSTIPGSMIPRPPGKVAPTPMLGFMNHLNPIGGMPGMGMMRSPFNMMGMMGYGGMGGMGGMPGMGMNPMMMNNNFSKGNNFGMDPKINLLNPTNRGGVGGMMPGFNNNMNRNFNNKMPNNNMNNNNNNQDMQDSDQQNNNNNNNNSNQGNNNYDEDAEQQYNQDQDSQQNSNNYQDQDNNYDQDSLNDQSNGDDYRNDETSNNRQNKRNTNYNNNNQSNSNRNYQNNNNNNNNNSSNYNNSNRNNNIGSNRSNNQNSNNNNNNRNRNDNNYDQSGNSNNRYKTSNNSNNNNNNGNSNKGGNSQSNNSNSNRNNYNNKNNSSSNNNNNNNSSNRYNNNNNNNNNYQDSDYSDNQYNNNYNDNDNSKRDRNQDRSRNRTKDDKKQRDNNNNNSNNNNSNSNNNQNQNYKRDRDRDRSLSSNSNPVRSKKRISQSPQRRKDKK